MSGGFRDYKIKWCNKTEKYPSELDFPTYLEALTMAVHKMAGEAREVQIYKFDEMIGCLCRNNEDFSFNAYYGIDGSWR